MVNPIVDWTDDDVWAFLNGLGVEHCCLYDEGFTRLGCIGCPLSGSKNMIRDFERWPKYKDNYIRAFQRMIDNHPGKIKILDPNADTKFKLYGDENIGGGYDGLDSPAGSPMVQRHEPFSDSTSTTAIADNLRGGGGEYDGSRTGSSLRRDGIAMFRRWLKVALC
jgi:hypothetical protein